mmetsp:Transcript_9096/g.27028  ORF Transcript_9096/g.27028 Transcript_9096/m.27028 type:complete len:513 (+) Transcript_9096:2822-4360(+)
MSQFGMEGDKQNGLERDPSDHPDSNSLAPPIRHCGGGCAGLHGCKRPPVEAHQYPICDIVDTARHGTAWRFVRETFTGPFPFPHTISLSLSSNKRGLVVLPCFRPFEKNMNKARGSQDVRIRHVHAFDHLPSEPGIQGPIGRHHHAPNFAGFAQRLAPFLRVQDQRTHLRVEVPGLEGGRVRKDDVGSFQHGSSLRALGRRSQPERQRVGRPCVCVCVCFCFRWWFGCCCCCCHQQISLESGLQQLQGLVVQDGGYLNAANLPIRCRFRFRCVVAPLVIPVFRTGAPSGSGHGRVKDDASQPRSNVHHSNSVGVGVDACFGVRRRQWQVRDGGVQQYIQAGQGKLGVGPDQPRIVGQDDSLGRRRRRRRRRRRGTVATFLFGGDQPQGFALSVVPGGQEVLVFQQGLGLVTAQEVGNRPPRGRRGRGRRRGGRRRNRPQRIPRGPSTSRYDQNGKCRCQANAVDGDEDGQRSERSEQKSGVVRNSAASRNAGEAVNRRRRGPSRVVAVVFHC